jgi:hypothetical protein
MVCSMYQQYKSTQLSNRLFLPVRGFSFSGVLVPYSHPLTVLGGRIKNRYLRPIRLKENETRVTECFYEIYCHPEYGTEIERLDA